MRFALVTLVLSAAACSDTAERRGDPWGLDDDVRGQTHGATTNAVPECSTDNDCPQDYHCLHPEACGEPARCEPGYSGCSAAAPYLACSCEGVVEWVAAGCPGPHAWQTGNLTHEQGASCDATASAPFDFEITTAIAEHEAFATGDAYAKLANYTISDEVRLVDDRRTVTFEGPGDAWTSFSLHVLIDRDGDGRCTPEVDEDYVTVTETSEVDFHTFVVHNEGYLNRVSDPCVRWE